MAKKIGIGIAIVLLALVVVIATRPGTFHIERSRDVLAPPGLVFAQVDDFHAWSAWSPWEKLDPQLKRTYSGAERGVGAKYAWEGNDKVGTGNMTILESTSPSKVVVRLEFIKPFAATNTATFTFTPTSNGTHVTWAMDGANGFVAKAASLVMDMDKVVGGDFERGLTSMAGVAEAKAHEGSAPPAGAAPSP